QLAGARAAGGTIAGAGRSGMSRRWPLLAALLVGAVVLGLLWWAWQHVGLGALQLGMGAC
ncbi:hypothetical protein PSYPI_34675, partial [Pseudomonas syringae pv. pisi str. 1704B]